MRPCASIAIGRTDAAFCTQAAMSQPSGSSLWPRGGVPAASASTQAATAAQQSLQQQQQQLNQEQAAGGLQAQSAAQAMSGDVPEDRTQLHYAIPRLLSR